MRGLPSAAILALIALFCFSGGLIQSSFLIIPGCTEEPRVKAATLGGIPQSHLLTTRAPFY